MLAFSIYLATSVYHAVGFVQVFPHFFGAAYPLPLLFGPLIYLYAVAAADRDRRLTWRDALHLAPFIAPGSHLPRVDGRSRFWRP
jgi:hypothetical protein